MDLAPLLSKLLHPEVSYTRTIELPVPLHSVPHCSVDWVSPQCAYLHPMNWSLQAEQPSMVAT